MGDEKGAELVLMVEILPATLTGAHFGFEGSSFFSADGEPPSVGQFLLAIDPGAFSGGVFPERLDSLIDAILAQQGSRWLELRAVAEREGLSLPTPLFDELQAIAGKA